MVSRLRKNGDDPVVFARAGPTIMPLGNASGGTVVRCHLRTDQIYEVLLRKNNYSSETTPF